jgi:response regulator RpfG family c-di-GMP phosphodiesterase
MRWKEGKMIEQDMFGLYFPGEGEYDLDRNGTVDLSLYTETKPKYDSKDPKYADAVVLKIGSEILGQAAGFQEISRIILNHHERYDGKGYPNNAELGFIPLGARIIAVCDSIDAMASARAYRKALPMDTCRTEIEKNIGTMYDPRVAMTALAHWEELTRIYREENEKAYKFSIDLTPQ